MFRFLLLINIILIFNSTFSQELRKSTVNDNKLKHQLIRCVILDYKNRLWCGTDDGIICYDGNDIISFRNTAQQKKISDNYILSGCNNTDASILVFVSSKGLTWINTKSMKSYFTIDSVENKNNLTDASPLVYVGKNQFWMVSHSKLISLKLSETGEAYALDEMNVSENAIENNKQVFTSIASDKMNKLLVVTDYIFVTEFDVRNFSRQRKFGPFRTICNAIIMGDSYVIGSFDGISIIDRKTGVIKNISLSGLTYMHLDDKLNLWFVVNKTQVYKLDVSGNIRLIYQMNEEETSRYQHVFCLATDNQNLWMGTSKGLITIKLPKPYFKKVITQSEELNVGELSSRGMLQINDTNVLLCGYHYFKSYNPIRGTITNLLSKKDAESISPYALCRTGDTVWISSEGAGIKFFSLKKGKLLGPLLNGRKKHALVSNGFVRTCYLNGNWMYLAEYGYIGRANYKTGEIVCSQIGHEIFGQELSGIVQIIKRSANELIVINNYSVSLIDTNFKVINTIYPSRSINANPEILNCIAISNKNHWIGTASKGLFFINDSTKELRQFTTEDGLSDNTIYSLLYDKNYLFIGTKNGLSIYDINNHKFRNFYEEDGLAGNEFNCNSYLKLKNGDLLMGGVNGVTHIKTKLLDENSHESKFFFSKIILKNESGNYDSVITGNLENLKEIILPYQHRFFKVNFTITNYSANNRFAYQLEGAGNDWIDLGNQNNITFNSLEPGNYALRIKGWDDNGEIISKQLELHIKANQVFYKTTGFFVVFVISLLLIASLAFYFFYKIKIRNIQRLADLRLKIASELHDQVGGLLNKTAIQAELVSSKNLNKIPQLDKIALNSRTALSSMRDILWNLDPRNDNTASLLERMKEYVLRMLQDDFDYSLTIEGIDNIELSHEIRQNLNMIFKEAINNIVKHAAGSKVKIFFGLKNDQLQLSVHSSNVLKTDLISTGQGIRNMRMRAETIKAQFFLSIDNGVEICVKLPFHHIKM